MTLPFFPVWSSNINCFNQNSFSYLLFQEEKFRSCMEEVELSWTWNKIKDRHTVWSCRAECHKTKLNYLLATGNLVREHAGSLKRYDDWVTFEDEQTKENGGVGKAINLVLWGAEDSKDGMSKKKNNNNSNNNLAFMLNVIRIRYKTFIIKTHSSYQMLHKRSIYCQQQNHTHLQKQTSLIIYALQIIFNKTIHFKKTTTHSWVKILLRHKQQ